MLGSGMRGVFAVGEPSGSRWELALDLLRQGESFSLGPVTFRRIDSRTVEAAVASTWQFDRVTEESAAKDLREAKAWVEQLVATDEPFRRAVGESSIDYFLVDDYEIGYWKLCRLVDNDIEWLTQPPT